MSALIAAIDDRPFTAAAVAALLPLAGLALYLSFDFYLIPLALGLGAGVVHVLSGPDHLAAIAPLAARRGLRPWRTGLVWGAGHTGGVWAVAAAVLLVRDLLPVDALSSWSERLVGLSLIAIGGWSLHTVRQRRPARPHVHAAGAVGVLHGLAGSAHLLGLLPALALPTPGAAVAYLLAFGLGSIAAMSGFAAIVGGTERRFDGRRLLVACSVLSIAVGGYWTVA